MHPPPRTLVVMQQPSAHCRLLLASWLMLAAVALGDSLANAPQQQQQMASPLLAASMKPKTIPQAPHLSASKLDSADPTTTTTTTLQTTTLADASQVASTPPTPANIATSGIPTPDSANATLASLKTASPGDNSTSEEPPQTTTTTRHATTWAPRSERAPIVEMFHKFFLKARSHDDQDQKMLVRDGVVLRMRELGFETSFLQKSRFEFRRRQAFSYNMISILPGKWRQTRHERIVLVGAHWDSATKAPGVDDNGSGSVCLLEIARLLSKFQCQFNHTIMLVWFDYEEQGKYGSEFFVNDYLYPYELDKYKSQFVGAFILDMILVRDKEPQTQTLPAVLRPKLSDFFEELEREKNRGDFLATWARKKWDEPLENVFRDAWIQLGFESRTFKAMRPELPQARLPNADERYEWKDFFRSDHASFWFPPLTSPAVRRAPNRTASAADHASLNAILLTDLGPWRQSYAKCYHSTCDDEHLLTEGNLAFMQQVVDALVVSLLRLAGGQCQPPPSSVSSSTAAVTRR